MFSLRLHGSSPGTFSHSLITLVWLDVILNGRQLWMCMVICLVCLFVALWWTGPGFQGTLWVQLGQALITTPPNPEQDEGVIEYERMERYLILPSGEGGGGGGGDAKIFNWHYKSPWVSTEISLFFVCLFYSLLIAWSSLGYDQMSGKQIMTFAKPSNVFCLYFVYLAADWISEHPVEMASAGALAVVNMPDAPHSTPVPGVWTNVICNPSAFSLKWCQVPVDSVQERW